MQFFEMRWPIIDHNLTRRELMEEAREDLTVELDKIGLCPLSHPVFSWPDPFTHAGAYLVARLAVAEYSRSAVG
jgi:hypothetical protein